MCRVSFDLLVVATNIDGNREHSRVSEVSDEQSNKEGLEGHLDDEDDGRRLERSRCPVRSSSHRSRTAESSRRILCETWQGEEMSRSLGQLEEYLFVVQEKDDDDDDDE